MSKQVSCKCEPKCHKPIGLIKTGCLLPKQHSTLKLAHPFDLSFVQVPLLSPDDILAHPLDLSFRFAGLLVSYIHQTRLRKKDNTTLFQKSGGQNTYQTFDLDLFRCVITAARSTFTLPPQLIGEALHVYTCRWLPYLKSKSHSGFSVKENEAALERHRHVVNTVVNMIPADKGSVSEGFLLRLVSIASYVGASLTTKTELIRKAGLQLDEATPDDLLLRSHSSSHHRRYDTDLVATVLESLLMLWRRQSSAHLSSNNSQLLHSIRKVAKLIDSYLQTVAQDVHMSVSKFVFLAEAVPYIPRESHDRLYKAINIYLKISVQNCY
ncbi:PREDICTED: BTB/POZ domain-containing protein At5g47800-like [Camelina sativa]|uniref:BTB/POZ domain-containing protein At5g47800-like n=1 Tax=Camelina sativa TaxID=90675 RepID=A0ABM1RET4_CAMSA|nr:PREDICTED: BTB/POZ domain-containing protein At5g47800-like [Camelina sativa]